MQKCQQGANPAYWEASLAKDRKPWWQGSVPPMMRDPGHSPTSNMIVSEVYSSYTLYTAILSMLRQWYNSFNRVFSSYMLHPILQCIQSTQGSGPILHTSRRVFLSTWQWPNGICVYNVTTLKGDNLPLLWYLGKLKLWRKSSVLWNFSYPNPEYPETSLTLGTPR